MRIRHDAPTAWNRVSLVLLAAVLFLATAGTAWALGQGKGTSVLYSGDYWYYAFADSKNEIGVKNTTSYNAATWHCTRLRSNGTWRNPIFARANITATDSDSNTLGDPVEYTDYDAAIAATSYAPANCMTQLASSYGIRHVNAPDAAGDAAAYGSPDADDAAGAAAPAGGAGSPDVSSE